MMALVFTRKGGNGNDDGEPPTPPLARTMTVPVYPHFEITRAIQAKPESARAFITLAEAVLRHKHGYIDGDEPTDTLQLLTGRWESDYSLIELLRAWKTLKTADHAALRNLALIAQKPSEAVGVGREQDVLSYIARRVPHETALELAGWFSDRVVTGKSHRGKKPSADADPRATQLRTLEQYAARLTDEQIAAVVPLIVALADRSPEQHTRRRRTLRDLLRTVLSLEDWQHLARTCIDTLYWQTPQQDGGE